MKNSITFLWLSLILMGMVGCKPATIDINEDLKRQTEETFMKAPTRSYLVSDGSNLRIVEYAFDKASQSAVRKELNFKQNVLYEAPQNIEYSYAWGEFGKGMFGRYINLTGDANRVLYYLNDLITDDDDLVMNIAEPRVDLAHNMIMGLTDTCWEGGVNAYIYQLHWVDTTVYNITWKGKIPTVDTIFMRMPRPNYYDTAGVDSCIYYRYTFANGANTKEANLKVEVQKNRVDTVYKYWQQYQDPTKYDTIITYKISKGPRVLKSETNYAFWTIADITTSNEVENLDVLVAEQGKDTTKLAITAFEYDSLSGKGSFNLNNVHYEKQ